MNLQKPYNVLNNDQPIFDKLNNSSMNINNYNPTPSAEKNSNNTYYNNNRYQLEEEPTFTYENERNINQYKSYILSKQKLTELNSQNYMNYILQQKKNRSRSPFVSRGEYLPSNVGETPSFSEFNNISNSYKKPTPITSLYNRSRLNEITNPDMYYKQSNQDYIKYKEQQRNYLNSNYELMINNGNYKKKLDVNPYNVNSSKTTLGESTLIHNTILNPLPNYTYNKYFDEEYKRNHSKRRSNSSFLV